MAEIELDHTETWTLRILRDGDPWPDIIQGPEYRPRYLFPTEIKVTLSRGAKRADITVHGLLRKQDGSVGQRTGHMIFGDDIGWVAELVAHARLDHDLVQVTTGVPL